MTSRYCEYYCLEKSKSYLTKESTEPSLKCLFLQQPGDLIENTPGSPGKILTFSVGSKSVKFGDFLSWPWSVVSEKVL